tara:strand:- start:16342 stop:16536 length:195 start_codon:yes stop_codon:yes gene_type:complete
LSEKVVLFCRVTQQLKRAIEEKAKQEHRSASTLVEVILEKELLDGSSEKENELKKVQKVAGYVS